MPKKPIDLPEVVESAGAKRMADRLDGRLSETGEKIWRGDFTASGRDKGPPSG